ncbi:hypothetical protein GCM10025768_12740 [Microbacterium pseudoresistens]|uniref:DNA polymerase III subunit gamma/tau n=1 Tax=Microbacterium pseudoresistens TaxID=640634 RepID=A0A7Y9JMT7_9MICO|nr:hypothetical protein [Microbacterium pseudoresistens]NYD55177.1 hypothetical protein [Microbacterium pseudoresistens]
MNSDPEDALRWEGDESGASAPSLPTGWTAVGKGADEVPTEHDGASSDDRDRPLGNGALLSVGIIGGVFLLYTVGWVIGAMNLRPSARFLVSDEMYLPWFWISVAAPALWFLAAWVLTRGRAPWQRILWLVAGVVLLVPWPFVMTGVMGA